MRFEGAIRALRTAGAGQAAFSDRIRSSSANLNPGKDTREGGAINIVGLTTQGDAAAALVCDGEMVAAVEEERFSRVKHHSGFPHQALRYCLDSAGIDIREVDHISLYWQPWKVTHKAAQAARTLLWSREMFKARVDRGIAQIGGSYVGMFRHPQLIRSTFGESRFRFHYLDHHMCHAASAFLVSPFLTSAILTMDGTGEATTTMMATGKDVEIKALKRVRLPHSLGQFYSAVTNFLGFDMMMGDEWKVMGLAAYGKPEYYDFLSRVLSLNGPGSFRVDVRKLDHHLAKSYQFSPESVREMGPPRRPDEEVTERHQNIAASAQLVLEDTVLHLLRWLHQQTGEKNLCLAGGVAFNSVMNGRIVEESPFERIFIPPAAGDAGCAVGAAYLTYHTQLRNPRTFEMRHAYHGPSFDSAACASALASAGLQYETLADEELLPRVARLLADGAIVGWFQGRAEFGPRALGNRSFLGDPRRPNMREILNRDVKLREWFRPLAPSMHVEAGEAFFGHPHYDPFMTTVLHVIPEMRSTVPSVVHVDGTARPQTVKRELNPRYWALIEEFRKLTGVPVLLNTSFNVQEPIVCTPEHAIRTFNNASFQALVLADNLVIRAKGGLPDE